ncbi:MAG: FAD:protein FMN transferase [Proteobacteria bacterium]|nr:FAD:protein FMN transferase [Pseudomonadota bacterium]
MMNAESGRSFSRRRVLSILAAGAALPLCAGRAWAMSAPYRWQGIALGAQADLTLYADDRATAMEAIAASLDEIERLERIFSLHRADSALMRLNQAGKLETPPVELIELLSLALSLSARSGGRFDPTVQPLWRLYADHFAAPGAAPEGPALAHIRAARALVDWQGVMLSPARIAFAKPGMQLTLNSLAQGYISDRVAELLQARGFTHCLVNLGELRALGPRADGTPWQIALTAPGNHDQQRATEPVSMGAMATSAGAGLRFDQDGTFNHIIDATSLRCANPSVSVTVQAETASVADGLSTIGTMMLDDRPAFAALLQHFKGRALILTDHDAGVERIG